MIINGFHCSADCMIASAQSYISVIKNEGSALTDSELDTIIILRKMLTALTGNAFNNDNMPSKVVEVSF